MRTPGVFAAILCLGIISLDARAGGTDAPLGIIPFADPGQPSYYRPLDETQAAQVGLGQSVFNTQWVAPGKGGTERREGLGPLYNANSCAMCHPGGARGAGPAGSGPAPVALEIQLEVNGGARGLGDPVYGHVLNTTALDNATPEGTVTIRYSEIYGYYYPDGVRWRIRTPHYVLGGLSRGPLAPTTVVKPRLAPALFGVGLLEAVPKSVIGDDPQRGGLFEGRFGWQEEASSVRDQTTRALSREMGLTSRDRPNDDCTSQEAGCSSASTDATNPEVADELLDAVVAFEHALAVPASSARPKNATLGSSLFVSIGCAECHRARLPVVLPGANGATLSGVISPYTDLRLHDLGTDMADEEVSGARVASKWRTAPLWGFGFRLKTESQPTFLHDGRARTPEEAILWHGGEGASARRQFTNLGPRSRAALLHWLETL